MQILQNPTRLISFFVVVALCGCHTAPARTVPAPARTDASPVQTDTSPARTGIAPARDGAASRARVAFAGALPPLDGQHLEVSVVEVRYGPGEASPPHSHPCPVVGYVAEGAIRTQTKGGREFIYRAGETFYETPNGVHLVSANASSEEPAKLIATFICDHDGPLTVGVSHLHLTEKKVRSR